MNRLALAIILLTLNLLTACSTPISMEQFNLDLTQVVNDKDKLDKYIGKPYSGRNFDATLKDILSDELVVSAIYQHAIAQRQASSVETILSTDWIKTFQRKGALFLKADDKKYIFEGVANVLAKAPSDTCKAFFKGDMSDLLLIGDDRTRVNNIIHYAWKSGAIAYDMKVEAPDKAKVGVAFMALLAKAKERMTDEEIEPLMRQAIEGKPLQNKDICTVGNKIALFAAEIEPRYLNILFNQLVFLNRESL